VITICVSGGFDPLHVGHLALFSAAATRGVLVVILNSDEWLRRKKGYCLMPWEDRAKILGALTTVSVVRSVDDTDGTVCEALRRIKPTYFAKSGDRTPETMPETELQTCQEIGTEILYNVCPHTPHSSSAIVAARNGEPAIWKKWGHYQVLDARESWKVKRLEVAPGQRLSLQRHEYRAEQWTVVQGSIEARVGYGVGQSVHVPQGSWHQLINPDKSQAAVLIEVQYGTQCEEEDIERR
jgi:cytidyltransferase-like protein